MDQRNPGQHLGPPGAPIGGGAPGQPPQQQPPPGVIGGGAPGPAHPQHPPPHEQHAQQMTPLDQQAVLTMLGK